MRTQTAAIAAVKIQFIVFAMKMFDIHAEIAIIDIMLIVIANTFYYQ